MNLISCVVIIGISHYNLYLLNNSVSVSALSFQETI
jgi:hypothetical protein